MTPQYRTLRRHFLGDGANGYMVEAGVVVEYDGVPGRWLLPINAEAEKRVKQAEKDRDQRAKLVAEGKPLPPDNAPLIEPNPAPRLHKSHPRIEDERDLEADLPKNRAKRAAAAGRAASRRAKARRLRPGSISKKDKADLKQVEPADFSNPAPQGADVRTLPEEQ